jgi:hypothetical protein
MQTRTSCGSRCGALTQPGVGIELLIVDDADDDVDKDSKLDADGELIVDGDVTDEARCETDAIVAFDNNRTATDGTLRVQHDVTSRTVVAAVDGCRSITPTPATVIGSSRTVRPHAAAMATH